MKPFDSPADAEARDDEALRTAQERGDRDICRCLLLVRDIWTEILPLDRVEEYQSDWAGIESSVSGVR